jgi:hypothetical protein
MSCPRCGFPESIDRCDLCGLTEFDAYELKRFEEESSNRFELTLCIPSSIDFNEVNLGDKDELPRLTTSSNRPDTYIFFGDGTSRELAQFLEALKGARGWTLLINGRPRPFTEALWLPLLELLTSSGE